MLISGSIPPLRQDIEIIPTEESGQPMIVLADPQGLSSDMVRISPVAALVASLFDGQRKAEDIQSELSKLQVVLAKNEIQSLADELKRHGFLETADILQKRRALFEDFRKSPVRKFSTKLRGIPGDPIEYSLFLGKYFKDPQGPGERFSGSPEGKPLLGLASPHIDFFRGGPHYAWAYGELLKRPAPDVIVAVGVAHQSPRSPWVLTRKSYETPLGPMEVDTELCGEIAKSLWYDAFEEEWFHFGEHSLEFQALWLKYIWPKDTPKWVPILCSNFDIFCGDKAPSAIESIEDGLTKVAQVLIERRKRGQNVLVLAGIDLAHVGRRFGDETDVTDELKKKIEALDRLSLEAASKLDADSFFKAGTGENAWRKVCGLSALYTSLRWIKSLSNGNPIQSRLLSYGQAADPAGGIVSFASLSFE